MKKLIIFGAVVLSISACKSGAGGWSSVEKETFVNSCVSQAKATGQMTDDKAKSYCSCMADKVEKKYPKAIDAQKMSISDVTDMAKDCIK